MTSRRSFLTGLAGTVICAPAIVRASSLMAVKSLTPRTLSSVTVVSAGSGYTSAPSAVVRRAWVPTEEYFKVHHGIPTLRDRFAVIGLMEIE